MSHEAIAAHMDASETYLNMYGQARTAVLLDNEEFLIDSTLDKAGRLAIYHASEDSGFTKPVRAVEIQADDERDRERFLGAYRKSFFELLCGKTDIELPTKNVWDITLRKGVIEACHDLGIDVLSITMTAEKPSRKPWYSVLARAIAGSNRPPTH